MRYELHCSHSWQPVDCQTECSGVPDVIPIPRVFPGDVPDNDCYCPASMNMASLHLFALANGRFNTDIEHWFA